MLDISARYPLQVDTSDPAGYPRGKARNVGTLGDGSGTPFEKDLLNDILGLQQALITLAGITPSGLPDKVGASDQLTAIQYIAETSRCEFNVKKLGLKGDNVTDDAAQLAVICALLVTAFGGGILFFPPGSYVSTTKFVLPPNISVRGIPGLSIWKINHATNRLLSLESGTWTAEAEIYGITFEAKQANSGDVIYVDPAVPTAKLRFRECSSNTGSLLAQGNLLNNSAGAEVTFEDCRMVSAKTAASTSFVCAGNTRFSGGEYTMAPGATYALIENQNYAGNELVVEGVRFVQVSTVGGIGFVRMQGGSLIAEGNRFAVNDSGAGLGTFGFEWGGGGAVRLFIGDDNDFNTVTPYKATACAVDKSRIKLFPIAIASAAVSFTMDNFCDALFLDCSAVTPPTVLIHDPIVPDQDFEIVVRNTHGSGTWASAALIGTADTVQFMRDAVTGPNLANGTAVVARFKSRRDGAGALHWVQVKSWVVVS